jgi:phospholipase D1/2
MTGVPTKVDFAADHHHDPGLAHTGADVHKHDGSNHPKLEKVKDRIHHPFPHLREKLKHTHLYDFKIKASHAKHQAGKFTNIVNRNHRHDERHEKATDEKRTRVAEGHRFESFAPIREGNDIKWYVDGRDYFWVSTAVRLSGEVNDLT